MILVGSKGVSGGRGQRDRRLDSGTNASDLTLSGNENVLDWLQSTVKPMSQTHCDPEGSEVVPQSEVNSGRFSNPGWKSKKILKRESVPRSLCN